jgi:hypothetical protein
VRWTTSCEGTLKEKVQCRARLGDDDAEYQHALRKAQKDLIERTWEGPGRDQEGYMSDCSWTVQLSDSSWREVPECFAEEAKPLFGKFGHLLVLAFTIALAVIAPLWIAVLMGICLHGGKRTWDLRPTPGDGQRLDWLLGAHYRGLKEVSLLGGD